MSSTRDRIYDIKVHDTIEKNSENPNCKAVHEFLRNTRNSFSLGFYQTLFCQPSYMVCYI